MTRERKARYANDPASVAAARRFARDVVGEVAPAIVDRVALVVSELASNAVRHSSSGFGISIRTSKAGVLVEVTDDSDSLPVMRHPGRMEPTGRGLLIVQSLSEEWGVVEREKGKAVWALLAASSAGAARQDRLASSAVEG